MMRIWFSILLLVAIAIGLALFPTVASQMMTIEMMGWHLEVKQGVFLAVGLLLLLLMRLLLWLGRIILKGPQQLITAWRNGGRKRQERRVRDGLTAWANGDMISGDPFADTEAVLPVWLADALATLIAPDQKQHDEASPLMVAIRGRQLSNEEAKSTPLAIRTQAVECWSRDFPRSVLARQRALALAEEGEDWQKVVQMIDQAPRGVTIVDSNARKANALLQLSKTDSTARLERLRQAAKLVDSDDIVIALASAHMDGDDLKAARGVLLDRLDREDSLTVAQALAAQEARLDNPRLTLQMLEKRCKKKASFAQRWLLVELSKQAEDEERTQHHLRLLQQMPNGHGLAEAMEAQLHFDRGEWESAARCYHQRLSQQSEG